MISIFLIIFYSQFMQYQILLETEKELVLQLEEQKNIQLKLEEEKSNYENSLYIEEIARNKLGLVKPEETIYINEAAR